MICPNCGTKMPEGYSFCGICGIPLVQESQPTTLWQIGYPKVMGMPSDTEGLAFSSPESMTDGETALENARKTAEILDFAILFSYTEPPEQGRSGSMFYNATSRKVIKLIDGQLIETDLGEGGVSGSIGF